MRFEQKWQAAYIGDEGRTAAFPARVPGNVQRDYAESLGKLDTLMYGENIRMLEALEDGVWEYTTELEYEAEPESRVFFVAEGIDYAWEIFLNDDSCRLGKGEGMFTPVEIELTDIAKRGDTLIVRILPHPKNGGGEAGTREEARRSVKPAVHYGWDFNPRLLISGFWKPAYVETRKPLFITKCAVDYLLDVETRTAEVRFDIEAPEETVITVLDPAGKVVRQGTETEFTLEDVQLWWCRGQGAQALYTWTAETADDKKTGTIGFRTVRLVMNEGTTVEEEIFPKGPLPAPMTICLNGRRIFAKGSNITNADIFNANTTKEQSEFLVSCARDMNMNILRIWGGGGLCKPEFYEACDREGIMVWQEFPLACNCYPDEKPYLRVLEQEARSIIAELKEHPALVLWCGGNELFNSWSGMTDQSRALRLLNRLCYDLDPERPFIMTSPRNGVGHGGYFFRDPYGREVYEIFGSSSMTAYCEFGVTSMAPMAQLKKIIPPEALEDLSGNDASLIYHHAIGAWHETSHVYPEMLADYFGEGLTTAEQVRYSQWTQAEGYKAIFEEARRQWPHCSMAMNWCLNEPWITAANNAIVSYPDIRKPACDAIGVSLQDRAVSARFKKFSWCAGEALTLELCAINDLTEDWDTSVTVRVLLENSERPEEDALVVTEKAAILDSVPAGRSLSGPVIEVTLPRAEADRLVIELETENGTGSNSYVLLYRK